MKKALSLFLAVLMIFGSFAGAIHVIATADNALLEENGFIYEITNGYATIRDYINKEFTGEIVIPDTLGGYTVKELGAESFRGCQCTAVSIPASIYTVDPEAFAYDMPNMERFNVDENNTRFKDYNGMGILYCSSYKYDGQNRQNIVAYPKNAPYTTIEIDTSVDIIGAFAFAEAKNLKSVVFANGAWATYYHIFNYAFYNAKSLESVDIGFGLSFIGDYAFEGCSSLTSVTFPNTLTGDGGIGWDSFKDTPFINTPDNYDEDGVFYLNNHLLATLPEADKEYYEIKDGTRSVAGGAFRWDSLKEVYLPSSVKYIQANPFARCPNIEKFTFDSESSFYVDNYGALRLNDGIVAYPNGIYRTCYVKEPYNYKIRAYAFYQSPIKCFYINSKTEYQGIKYLALGGDTVTDIYYEGTEEDWKDDLLYKKKRYEKETTAEEVAEYHYESYSQDVHQVSFDSKNQAVCSCGYTDASFSDSENKTENNFIYDIVDGNAVITGYKDTAFTGQIEIPETLGGYPVTEIGREAFRGCLCTSVMISAGLEKIHPEAFAYDMPNLEAYYTNPLANSSNSDFYANNGILYQTVYGFSMIFAYPKNKPEKTYKIDDGYVIGVSDFAFCEVKNLEEFTITGYQFSGVGNYAFYGAKNLKKITIDNCLAIGEKAFANCEKLDDIGIDLDNGLLLFGSDAFENTAFTNDLSNYDPDGVLYYNNYLITSLPEYDREYYAIKDGTNVVAGGAFDWDSLEEVYIPSSIISMNANPFYRCANLKNFDVSDAGTFFTDAYGVLRHGNVAVSYPNGRFQTCYVLNTVNEVAYYAFYGSPIRNFYIPTEVELRNYALGGDTVTDIHYQGEKSKWNSINHLDPGYGEMPNAIHSANVRFNSYSDEPHTVLTKTDTKSVCSCGYEAEFEKTNGEYSENGFTYRIVDGKAEIVTCPSFVTGDLVIPEIIGGFVVASIARDAFDLCKCTGIFIPSTVENIDKNSGIADLNKLTKINVASSNANYSSYNGVLYNKDLSVLLVYPDAKPDAEFVLPVSVERIVSQAFMSNIYLTKVSILENLEIIEAEAFRGCAKLETLNIYTDVDYIGDYAFRYCFRLKNLDLRSGIGYIGKDVFEMTYYSEEESNYDAQGALYHGTYLIGAKIADDTEHLAVKSGTTVIAAGAFKNWEKTTKVVIPSSVVTVGDAAFNGCPNLEKFVMASQSKYLATDEYGALYELHNNKKSKLIAYPAGNKQACYSIPDGITEIAPYALDFSDMLSNKYIPLSVKKIGKNGLGTNPDMIINYGGGMADFVQIDFAGENDYKKFLINNVEKKFSVVPEGTHYNSEITVTDPTCTEKGAQAIICECGYQHINEIFRNGHKPTGNVIVTVPATCTVKEIKVRYCSVCGEVAETYLGSSLGHKYVKTEQEVTCDQPGGIFYECSRCGDSYNENYVEPHGHTVTDKTKKIEPTCNEDGGLYKICDVCGETVGESLEVYPAKGHTEGEWTVETYSTCDKDGKEILPCSVCGETIDFRVIEKSHDYKETVINTTCTVETVRFRCSKCGDEYYRDTFFDKQHGRLEEIIEEPGCFTVGKKYNRCTACGVTVGTVETIPSTGHNHKVIETKEATCTQAGYEKSQCSKCGNTKTVHYPKLSHTFGKWEYESGNQFSGICSVCNTSFKNLKVSITLDYSSIRQLFSGETHKINATVTENISDDFIFTSSDTSVATVSADGTVTAVSPGRAVITVRLKGTEITANCTVAVYAKAYLINWMVGEDVYVVTSVKEGESITPPAPPEMEGYEFAGWSPEIPDVMPSHGLKFTAKFNEVVKSDKYDVSASYEEGCFDEDITLDVKEIETEREPGGVYMVEGKYYDQVGLYNIKAINDDSDVVQPNDGYKVTIKIALPEAYKHQTQFVIYHRFVGGGREQLSTAAGTVRVENGYLIFAVESFSEFEVLVPSASIKVTAAPTKVVYRYGEAIDLTGIRVVYTDDKGVTKTVTNTSLLTVSGFDSNEIGKQTVTVNYGQHSDTFEVEVRMTFWQWIIKILFFGLIKF